MESNVYSSKRKRSDYINIHTIHTRTNFRGTYILLMPQIQHFRNFILRITGFWHSIISMLHIIDCKFSRT